MSPLNLFLAAAGITLGAAAAQTVARRRLAAALRRLGQPLGMTYSPADRFGLVGRLIPHLPVPGAAAVHVRDVLYGTAGRRRVYVCVVECTTGAVRMKHRNAQAYMLLEPLDGDGPAEVYTVPDRRARIAAQFALLLGNEDARAEASLDPGASSLVAAIGGLSRRDADDPSPGRPG